MHFFKFSGNDVPEKVSDERAEKSLGNGWSPTSSPSSSLDMDSRKPTRPDFKVSGEGVYKLLNEFHHLSLLPSPKKVSTINPIKPCKFSFFQVQAPTTINSKESNISNLPPLQTEQPKTFFIVVCGDFLYFNPYKPISITDGKEHAKYSTVNFRFGISCTCLDINKVTSTWKKVDVILGFSAGDLALYDPIQKSICSHMNVECSLNNGRVNTISWLPNSTNQFLAGFSDGNVLLMEIGRVDQSHFDKTMHNDVNSFSIMHQISGNFNPISRWHISASAVNDLSFSPNGEYLATVSQDGYLRVFDFKAEKLLTVYRSFFGGLLCCAWSPDGKYLLSGGEDDCVCIWSLEEGKLLSRGKGHQSWVSRVLFDEWQCKDGNYRFASVGQDTRILLWDFCRENQSNMKSARCKEDSVDRIGAIIEDERGNASKPFSSATSLEDILVAPVLDPVGIHRGHTEPISDISFLRRLTGFLQVIHCITRLVLSVKSISKMGFLRFHMRAGNG